MFIREGPQDAVRKSVVVVSHVSYSRALKGRDSGNLGVVGCKRNSSVGQKTSRSRLMRASCASATK